MPQSRHLLLVVLACLAVAPLATVPACADTADVAEWTPRVVDVDRLGDVYHYQQFTFRPPKGWSQLVTNGVDFPSPRLTLTGPKDATGAHAVLTLMWLRPAKADNTTPEVNATLDDTLGYFKAALRGGVASQTERGTVNGRLFERATFSGTVSLGKPIGVEGFATVGRIPVAAGDDLIVAYGYDSQPNAADSIPLMESAVATIADTGVESDVREPFVLSAGAASPSGSVTSIGPFTLHVPIGLHLKDSPDGLLPKQLSPGEHVFVGAAPHGKQAVQISISSAPIEEMPSAPQSTSIDGILSGGIAAALTGRKSADSTYRDTIVEKGVINGIPFDRVYFAYTTAKHTEISGFAYCGYSHGWTLLIVGTEPRGVGAASLSDAEAAALSVTAGAP